MSKFWPAILLTGGGSGALDAIDGSLLSDGDGAVVITSSLAYFYYLNATSGASESSPDVISPDANAGDKRWILKKTNVTASDVGLGNVPNEDATDPYNLDQKGATDGQALVWSDANGRYQPGDVDLPAIETPSITSPSDGATGTSLTPTIQFSNYYSLYGKSQQALQVIIATDSDFTTVVHDETLGAVSEWEVDSSLDTETQHWVKGRYQDDDDVWGEYTTTISFTTADIYIDQPTNSSPADSATDIGETPTLSADAFNCVNGSDSHASSDWEIYSDASLETLVWSSYDDTENLESITVPAGELSESGTFYWHCRYNGTTYGDSEWSTETSFETASSFCPVDISDHGPGPGCEYLDYDETTDTGYYGYVGSGGEPTYASGTTYDTGEIVNDGDDEFFRSKTDSNTGNSLPSVGESNTNWEWIGSGTLTTGDSLASSIGLSAGTSQYSDEGWLKFFVGSTADCNTMHGTVSATNKVIFIAKKTYRNNLSWDDIYDAGAVFGTGDNGTSNSGTTTTQDASITIDGNTYNVRVLTGSEADPATEAYSNQSCADDAGGGSEWNDLFCRIHTAVPTCTDATVGMEGGSETTRHGGPQDEANWVDYPNDEVQVYSTDAGDGTYCWCQEQGNDTSRRVGRGYSGVAYFDSNTSDFTSANVGWRPVLVLQ